MDEEGVSHIAYFRTDGGSCKLYTQEYVDEKDKEIERLNNIINELEKTIEAYLEGCYCLETDFNLTSKIEAYEQVLDKLKELKEGNKE